MAERKAFLLRIDPELYDALSRWAADELRSLNGQIEYLLPQVRLAHLVLPRPDRLRGVTGGSEWRQSSESAGRRSSDARPQAGRTFLRTWELFHPGLPNRPRPARSKSHSFARLSPAPNRG